jgi:RNA polymerase sigma-70 factor (ECF subfamily)
MQEAKLDEMEWLDEQEWEFAEQTPLQDEWPLVPQHCHNLAQEMPQPPAQLPLKSIERGRSRVPKHTSLQKRISTPLDVVEDDLESHIRALRRYARALTANPDDADDLVQETLKRALTYLDSGGEIRNMRYYLLTILHHARIDHAKRETRGGEHIPFDTCLFLASGPIQSDRMVCSEAMDAVNRLPEEQRAVILLIGFEGLAYQEVADVLQIPIGTVMSRLNRARKNLRKILHLEDISVDIVSTQLEGGYIPEPSSRKIALSSDTA